MSSNWVSLLYIQPPIPAVPAPMCLDALSPIVTADVFVALNGRTSRRLIDPTVNLAVIKDGLWPKDFLIKYD